MGLGLGVGEPQRPNPISALHYVGPVTPAYVPGILESTMVLDYLQWVAW